MARNLDAKCRMCRRAGTKLYLKGDRCYTSKCAIVKRNYPPGVHGAKKGKSRLTTFGAQLREKQKARIYYGIAERQFRNYFDKATRATGDTGELMLTLLERRLDNVIYRLGWCYSRTEGRQLVSHGFFTINGKAVTIPSYQVSVGDKVELKGTGKSRKHFTDLLPGLEKHQLPSWLFAEKGNFQAKIVALPGKVEDSVSIFDMKPIVEFYSR